jgi:hypothetical protein
MKRVVCTALAFLVLILLTPLDVLLKLGTGVVLILLLWLPFGILAGASIRPWLWVGLGCGVFLLGLWDCCDMFGLNRIAEGAHARITGGV